MSSNVAPVIARAYVVAVFVLAGCGAGTSAGTPSPSLAGTGVTASPKAVVSATPSAQPAATAQVTATATPVAPSSSIVKWVSAWADAPIGAGPGPVVNMTVREIVKPTVGSRGTIRLHFSNFFGTSPITIGSVHVGTQTTGAAVAGDIPVTFAGAKSVTVPAGGFSTSDPMAYSFSYGTILAVTEYIEGTNPLVTFTNRAMEK